MKLSKKSSPWINNQHNISCFSNEVHQIKISWENLVSSYLVEDICFKDWTRVRVDEEWMNCLEANNQRILKQKIESQLYSTLYSRRWYLFFSSSQGKWNIVFMTTYEMLHVTRLRHSRLLNKCFLEPRESRCSWSWYEKTYPVIFKC